MPTHLKALVVVLVLSVMMFAAGRVIFSPLIGQRDFSLRRNTWLALTVAAFVIPNFWLYSFVAALIIVFAAHRDSNPGALYMFLLLAVPPLADLLPTFGLLNTSFYFDHFRLLSLVLLLPLAWRRPTETPAVRTNFSGVDTMVAAYVLLQVVLRLPDQSTTATVRGILMLGMDIVLPYFVVSRSMRSREMISDAMASFALAMMVLAPIAAFEMLKRWALYAEVAERWGLTGIIHYLTRGDFLRGQATSGHSLVLGYNLAVGFGFWLYLQTRVPGFAARTAGSMTLLTGLVASLARGSWVGSLGVAVTFFAVGPRGLSRLFKVGGAVAVVAAIAMASPWGGQIIDHLPFIGTVDAANVTYRQRLAEVSWNLILQHPLFGSSTYFEQMEELRQGEGIIDIVNVYLSVALSFGFVGLALYLATIGFTLLNCLRAARQTAVRDPDYSMMGASLVGCMVGMLLMMGTVNTYLSIPYLNWSVLGLGWAYWQLAPVAQLQSGMTPVTQHRSMGGRAT